MENSDTQNKIKRLQSENALFPAYFSTISKLKVFEIQNQLTLKAHVLEYQSDSHYKAYRYAIESNNE